jgi:hypothetical protein
VPAFEQGDVAAVRQNMKARSRDGCLKALPVSQGDQIVGISPNQVNRRNDRRQRTIQKIAFF